MNVEKGNVAEQMQLELDWKTGSKLYWSHSEVKVLVAQWCPSFCDPMDCSLLCPWNSPGNNTGLGRHFLLQGILPSQGSNPHLLPCRKFPYCLSQQESPHWNHKYPSKKKKKTFSPTFRYFLDTQEALFMSNISLQTIKQRTYERNMSREELLLVFFFPPLYF